MKIFILRRSIAQRRHAFDALMHLFACNLYHRCLPMTIKPSIWSPDAIRKKLRAPFTVGLIRIHQTRSSAKTIPKHIRWLFHGAKKPPDNTRKACKTNSAAILTFELFSMKPTQAGAPGAPHQLCRHRASIRGRSKTRTWFSDCKLAKGSNWFKQHNYAHKNWKKPWKSWGIEPTLQTSGLIRGRQQNTNMILPL